jgi:hypothetical protein
MKSSWFRFTDRAGQAAIVLLVLAGVAGFGMIARPADQIRDEGPGVKPLPVAVKVIE